MGKAVLIAIQPKWCCLIANGEKTVEVRKSRPKLEPPFKCYIYQTKKGKVGTGLFIATGEIMGRSVKNGTVIGEFVCDKFFPYSGARPRAMGGETPEDIERGACLSRKEIWEYEPNGNPIGWHISDLEIYDTPKDLSEFMKPCENDLYCEVCAMYSEFTEQCGNKALKLTRPPQSWCYVERLPETPKENRPG